MIPHALVHMCMGKAPLSGHILVKKFAGFWRAIEPLMRPWCAEGDVPTAANLNLYRHRDDEPLLESVRMPSSLFL